MAAGIAARGTAVRAAEPSFDRFAGVCGIVAGAASFLYSIAFVVLKEVTLYSILQLVGALASSAVLVALYMRLRSVEPGLSLWALLLAVTAALGSAIHAAYDLANATNPPKADVLDQNNLPNLVDPRGFLTFGVAGIAILGISWLMLRSRRFSASLAALGFALGVLLLVIWLGRLIILDAKSLAILVPAALAGFILNPAWYIWVGATLLRDRSVSTASDDMA